jgi:hypothetical protein
MARRRGARIDAHRGGCGRGSMRIAGMRAGIDAHRVKGGLTPTPAMPGMGRLWGFATKVASSG